MTWAPTGGFVLRSPALPFSALAAIVQATDPLAALRATLDDSDVREAIYLASPSLDDRIQAWLDGDETDAAATARSALSYVTRMSSRPTPFGLFAGCAVGSTGDHTALVLGPARDRRRHTRLDFGFLVRLVSEVGADPAARPALRFAPNSSLYRAGGRLRMVETRIDGDRRVRYHRVTFEEDDALASTLQGAAGGALLAELADHLVATLADDGVTVEEAAEFVADMVDSQLLVAVTEPAITGPEPIAGLVEAFRSVPAARAVADSLAEVSDGLDALDRGSAARQPATYRSLVDHLRKVDPDLDAARLFQADLTLAAADLSLGPVVVAKLRSAVETLHRISGSAGQGDLTRFAERFRARYEDRELPLAEVLDEEIGIGFGAASGVIEEGAPLLAGMVAVPAMPNEASGPSWTGPDAVRLRLLHRALLAGDIELRLSAGDIDELAAAAGEPLPLADAFSVTATLSATGEATDDREIEVVAPSVAGPSGARMLGRFCHADPDMDALVRRHLSAEELALDAGDDDVVLAEIVHLPEGRAGNVLSRPVLRAYEIPFLGRSGAEAGAQIAVEDLMVSVVGGRIVLRSARLGVEVRPRMTTAHNHLTSALATYRFLASLSFQGVAGGLQWRWGPLEASPFLPRVVADHLVLARARWLLTASELAPLVSTDGAADRREAAAALRDRFHLPEWVVVTIADHQLPVCLSTDLGLELLVHEVRHRPSIVLTELYPGPDRLLVESPEGRLTHEVLVPCARTTRTPDIAPAGPSGRRALAPVATDVERVHLPGSRWLSAKLYTGKATADAVLREAVTSLVGRLKLTGTIDRWFFLRYADPDWHLRVRLHAAADDDVGMVINELRSTVEPLVRDGRVWRVELDTYAQEVERYGGPLGIELSEALFAADSDAAAHIVMITAGDEGLDDRWRLALVGVDRLLGDLGFDLDERRSLVRSWAAALEAEQGAAGAEARRWGGRLFRTERAALQDLLAGKPTHGIWRTRGLLVLRDRSLAIAQIADALRLAAADGGLTTPLSELANSYCHMHVNRMLRASQRVQELVIYDLLDRSYQATIARRQR
jgi:thiopeptide-type bacteriocin biosynthesis protein